MARYIDADELIEEIKPLKISLGGKDIFADIAKESVLKIIDEQPTADVVEVKHGEWQLKSEIRRFLEEIDEEFYIECPFCHRVYYVPFEFEDEKMLEYAKKNYPYCNCGAKMDGGNAE